MSRQDALLRLHESLLTRKQRLAKKLAGEMAYLHDWKAADSAGDSADMAFVADGDDISLRLAELGERELGQIEKALARWNHGLYGICEGGSWRCQKKIPVARLKALPYASFCIQCERALEMRLDVQASLRTGSWAQIADAQAPMQEERINLAELERDLSGCPRG
jgi:DnaK suppressor protein